MKRSKRFKDLEKLVDKSQLYTLDEALELLKKLATAKFTETVELHVKLGINPKRSDQIVRGSVTLPHGTGKSKRVAVIVSEEKLKEAKESGADIYGSDELIEKISKGWLDFDVLIAEPSMMKKLAKLGRLLGPRGLMPNPKIGTLTNEIKKTVAEVKKGKINFRNDATGIVHVAVGKVSFPKEKLKENIKSFINELVKLKPPSSKGTYISSVSICSSMSPGIRLNPREI